jgi:hypothetical protein
MKKILLLTLCSVTFATNMEASYGFITPLQKNVTSRQHPAKMAGKVGRLCRGEFAGNIIANYNRGIDDEKPPVLLFRYNVKGEELYVRNVDTLTVNGRNVFLRDEKDPASFPTGFGLNNYRLKGSNRIYALKPGDRIRAIVSVRRVPTYAIECLVPPSADPWGSKY